MSNFYDDAKFGVIQRQWFGLSKKWGGSVPNARVASGVGCFGTTDATFKTHVRRWYPRGAIRMLKAGSFILATLSTASATTITARLTTRGASASAGCTWNIKSVTAPAAFASTVTFTVRQVKRGEYISINSATPSGGANPNTATQAGTVAFFVDYINTYDTAGTGDAIQA
jgi:hypothetical protein